MMNQKNIYVKIMQHMENIVIKNVQKLVKTDVKKMEHVWVVKKDIQD